MNNTLFNRFIFLALSFIWGSSFILMKEGLQALNPFEVASLRIISAGAVLLPSALRSIGGIPRNKIGTIFLSGFLGSLLPAYLFCIAEQHIDSALAGTLNALTPVFAILLAAVFFGTPTSPKKVAGVFISLTGSVLLFFAQPGLRTPANFADVLMIMLATMIYGFNINLVGKYLRDIPSLQIAAVALVLNAIPASVVLLLSGYFSKALFTSPVLIATGFTFILGIAGTALASVIFYMLIKRAGMIFSSMVTYVIPVVATGWGILYGEATGVKQAACLLVILAGVYLANRGGAKAV